MRRKGWSWGSFWWRWKAHTRFPNRAICTLKLIQHLKQVTHKSTEYSENRYLNVKVKAYISIRKASAYSCRFFCSAYFQLRSTTTGTLLRIRRPQRVSVTQITRVDHRHLHTRTHLVVQGVRTLRQWSSLPKAGAIWCSYCHELGPTQTGARCK